jgi:Flp pilus assembly pilin Flp
MRNQKGGAIFALLAGLIASAVAGATQIGGGVKKKKKAAKTLKTPKTQKRKPKRPRRRKYKKRV